MYRGRRIYTNFVLTFIKLNVEQQESFVTTFPNSQLLWLLSDIECALNWWPPQKEERASTQKSTLLSETPIWGAQVILSYVSRRCSGVLLNPFLNSSSSEMVKGLNFSEIQRMTSMKKRSWSSMIMITKYEEQIYKITVSAFPMAM